MMGYMLQPITNVTASLTDMGGQLSTSINSTRQMISNMRDFITTLIDNIFGVFLNLIIEFQRMIISIRDMVGKMVGIVMTILYVLDGSIKTMNSTWAAPPGQLVRAIGSCFHNTTEVQLSNESWCLMKNLRPGSTLIDGSIVHAVMNIYNLNNEIPYVIRDDKGMWPVYVTGNHFIWYDKEQKYIQVKHHPNAHLHEYFYDHTYVCLITTTGKICIGPHIFCDWEDDHLK
jgi:hypothetical protein